MTVGGNLGKAREILGLLEISSYLPSFGVEEAKVYFSTSVENIPVVGLVPD